MHAEEVPPRHRARVSPPALPPTAAVRRAGARRSTDESEGEEGRHAPKPKAPRLPKAKRAAERERELFTGKKRKRLELVSAAEQAEGLVLAPVDWGGVALPPFKANRLQGWAPGADAAPDAALKERRRLLGIGVRAAVAVPPPLAELDAERFPRAANRLLKAARITRPTAIQAQAWPAALAGLNVVG